MPEIANSFTLNTLSTEDRPHWELHLNAALKDDEGTPCIANPSLKSEAEAFLKGGVLPNIGHPSGIHDWLERPSERAIIEAYNG